MRCNLREVVPSLINHIRDLHSRRPPRRHHCRHHCIPPRRRRHHQSLLLDCKTNRYESIESDSAMYCNGVKGVCSFAEIIS